ncbi:MAG: phosphate ABC transporter ATP-binding protein [Actinobacteria bacterium]|nr:phosphate ABC transporter ATP-binding protein [Actinomycetota bacterium]
MKENGIEVRNLCKNYKDKQVLKNINFIVEKGKVLVIIGTNGAGKTTLMRILDLLEKPTSGKVLFEGEDVFKLPEDKKVEIRRRIGVVFQRSIVFNESVYENIAYGLRIRGIRNNVEEKVKRAADLVGLNTRDSSSKLSGGEKQLLAIARLLVIEPEVWLFDEPTSNLDPKNVAVFEKVIEKIKNEGKTVVLTTHNMFQAERFAEKVIFLFDGEIVETGNKEIFKFPRDQRTKAFINGEIG